jgi:nucleoid-associated protein YgaU
MAKEQKQELQNPDTMVSLFLGIAVVVVAGILIVNFFKNRKTTRAPSNEKETANQVTGAPSANLPTTHTVTAGETLWSISENYFKSGYNYVDIAQENKLSDANTLEIGQKLTIPSVAPKMPSTNTLSQAVEVKKPENSKYIVKSGDSLWKISTSVYGTGYRWTEIAKLNKLVNPDLIHSGNELMLP